MSVISVRRLATEIFPETPAKYSSQRLRRWIRADPMLMKLLVSRGYRKGARTLNSAQAALIRKYIG